MSEERRIDISELSAIYGIEADEIAQILYEHRIIPENWPDGSIASSQLKKANEILHLFTPAYKRKYKSGLPKSGKDVYKLDEKEFTWDDEQITPSSNESFLSFPKKSFGKIIGQVRSWYSSSQPTHLEVEVDIPAHFSDEQAQAFIAELVVKLDEANRDLGGRGLEIKDVEVPQETHIGEVVS